MVSSLRILKIGSETLVTDGLVNGVIMNLHLDMSLFGTEECISPDSNMIVTKCQLSMKL